MTKGLIITITGPSGTGKGSVSREVIKRDNSVEYFISATTRQPRGCEKDGVDYYFLTKQEFIAKIDAGDFLEWSEHYGNYYGVLRDELVTKLSKDIIPINDITWSGAASVTHSFPENTIKVLLLPPSLKALDERFAVRKNTSNEDDDVRRIRTEKIREDMQFWQEDGYVFTNDDMKGSHLGDYDYVVINEHFEETVTKLLEIIESERQKRA